VVVGETHVLENGRGAAVGSGPGAEPADRELADRELAGAVGRMRRELIAYRAMLPDRAVAEDELDALARAAGAVDRAPDTVDTERIRHSLLLVAAVIGSVSALTEPLDALREDVERLAPSRL
jgi:hypothetical protein